MICFHHLFMQYNSRKKAKTKQKKKKQVKPALKFPWEFPSSAWIRTPRFHCRGTKIPHAATWPNKNKIKFIPKVSNS